MDLKLVKLASVREHMDAHYRGEISYSKAVDLINKEANEQLMLGGVSNSSDLIVVELSDDEIKIISEQQLKEWQQSAIEFDGFEGWTVRGRLVKNR